MKKFLISTLAAGCLATQPLLAQRGDPANTLARARSVFDLADTDKDGKLTFEELQKQRLGIQKAEFDAIDVDKSSSWSRDEFLVYYRRLLLANRQRPAADLEAEVTRVEALRKAKEAEMKRATAQVGAAATTISVDDRLQLAIDELELKAAQRQATRAEFQHVRDLMIERSKAVGPQAAADAPDLQPRFEEAMKALETKAQAGGYSREDFNALRALLIQHARVAAATDATTDAETKLQLAIDDLEKKAALRQATRADFDHVRDAWTARAQAATVQDPVATADLRTKFEAAMVALETQAKQGNYTREEYTALREQLLARGHDAANGNAAPAASDLDTRLQAALDDLERKAQARQATREDFTRVRDAWTARAKAASVGADPTVAAQSATMAQQFQVAMDELEKDALAGNWSRAKYDAVVQSYVHRARAANGGAAPLSAAVPSDDASVQKRLNEAIDTLQAHALASGATREDYQRVKDLLIAHARESVKAADGASPAAADDPRVTALAAKLSTAIDQIEEQARAGKITRADFDTLRQMFVNRARAAANSATTANPAPMGSAQSNPAQSSTTNAPAPTGRAPQANPADTKPAETKPADAGVPASKGPADARHAADKEKQTPPPAPAPAPAPVEQPKPDDGSSGRDKPPPHRG